MRDSLISSYYRHFHKVHPCALPLEQLDKLVRNQTMDMNLKPLISVMRFIGSLYLSSVQSDELKHVADESMAEASQGAQDALMAQSHLLYSVALYWCDEVALFKEQLDHAIRIAVDLGMHHREFAFENGGGDLVMQESWRRTWWQIYLIDAHYAAIRQVLTFTTNDVDITTELPCEEREYESGVSISNLLCLHIITQSLH